MMALGSGHGSGKKELDPGYIFKTELLGYSEGQWIGEPTV